MLHCVPGVVLRSDALVRERKAARFVEERYASLIANASDVIMIVGAGVRQVEACG